MQVEQIMTRRPVSCFAHESLHEAARIMWEHECGFVPVVDEAGHVVGVVTDRDACMGAYTQGRPLREILVTTSMSKNVYFCHPEEEIARALDVMRRHRVRRLVVIDNRERLVGVLSLGDAVIGGAATVEIANTLRDVCRCSHDIAA